MSEVQAQDKAEKAEAEESKSNGSSENDFEDKQNDELKKMEIKAAIQSVKHQAKTILNNSTESGDLSLERVNAFPDFVKQSLAKLQDLGLDQEEIDQFEKIFNELKEKVQAKIENRTPTSEAG